MTEPRPADAPALTSDVAFARLEQLRALLRLTTYLAGFRPVAPPPSPPVSSPARDPNTR